MKLFASSRRWLAAAALFAGGSLISPAFSADIIDAWPATKLPAVPAVKPVSLKPSETALLMLDFGTICSAKTRPRCTDSLSAIAKLLQAARGAGALVAYSIAGTNKITDVPAAIAAKPDEPVVVTSGVDKFYGTDLEKILKDKGIHNVIVVGTSAHGAVLFTVSEAAMRMYNVIVPVDGMSADDQFGEAATAWILSAGPTSVSHQTTLTRANLISFH